MLMNKLISKLPTHLVENTLKQEKVVFSKEVVGILDSIAFATRSKSLKQDCECLFQNNPIATVGILKAANFTLRALENS